MPAARQTAIAAPANHTGDFLLPDAPELRAAGTAPTLPGTGKREYYWEVIINLDPHQKSCCQFSRKLAMPLRCQTFARDHLSAIMYLTQQDRGRI
jgi:hypothetical protein